FTKIEDATAGRLIIGPRNSLTQLAWARQAERTFYGARWAAWSCPDREGNVRWSFCPWRHIRSTGPTGSSIPALGWARRNLPANTWKRRGGLSGSGLLTYGQLKLLPQWDPLRGDPRFEKIVASLAPKIITVVPYSARKTEGLGYTCARATPSY